MMCSVFQRILLFTSLWKLLFALNGTIEIERHNINYTHEKWVYQPDTFKIPLTKCSSNISVYCGAMSGHSVGGCKCECNSERTTFGFFENQWKCTENSKVRQYGGCSLTLLRNRTVDSALITVPLRMEAHISFVIPTDLQRCFIIPFKSTYLLCNGSRNILDNSFMNSRFLIVESENTQFFTFKKTTSHLDYNDAMKGRILRMTIGCYNKSNTIIPDCLLLKMQGTFKCPQFSLPSLPKPTTSPWTISPTSETGTSAKELQTHNISSSQSTTMPFTKIVNKRKENAAGENDGGNTGWIIGVAAGVTGLMLIIVAIVIVMRRRKKRKNKARERERNPQTNEDGSHEMCTYENAIPIGSTEDRLQSSPDPIPDADYVNHRNPGFNVSDELVDEKSKAIKQKEGMTETLDSPMYSSLVGNIPHVYGSLKGLHKTHEDMTDSEVTCTSQNKENSLYQSLNTFGQQSHGEYQAPKYKKEKPDNKN